MRCPQPPGDDDPGADHSQRKPGEDSQIANKDKRRASGEEENREGAADGICGSVGETGSPDAAAGDAQPAEEDGKENRADGKTIRPSLG